MLKPLLTAGLLISSAVSVSAQQPFRCLGGFCVGDELSKHKATLENGYKLLPEIQDSSEELCLNAKIFSRDRAIFGGIDIAFDKRKNETDFTIKNISRFVKLPSASFENIIKEYEEKYSIKLKDGHYRENDYALSITYIGGEGKSVIVLERMYIEPISSGGGRRSKFMGGCPSVIPD